MRVLPKVPSPRNYYDMFVQNKSETDQCGALEWLRYDSNFDFEEPTIGQMDMFLAEQNFDLKEPANGPPNLLLYWTHTFQPVSRSDNESSLGLHIQSYKNITRTINEYLVLGNLGLFLVEKLDATDEDGELCFPEIFLSPPDVCKARHYCLIRQLINKYNDFYDCLGTFNITYEDEESSAWGCMIELRDLSLKPDCAGSYWDLVPDNWLHYQTDERLRAALQGGVDSDGLYWKGGDGAPLAETFGRQFWGLYIKCTLADPCQRVLDCTSVGSFTVNPMGRLPKPYPKQWIFLATAAFVNINKQLRNQYNELKDAIQSLALDTFSIDEFFPTKSQDFDLSNSLTGLSGIFSILGGFVPVAGPFISAAGTIASGVGTFLENSVAAAVSDDPLAAQRIFSQKVLFFYRASLKAMDDLFSKLFVGDPIPVSGPGSFTLLDMMEGGGWVDPNTLTNVSSLNEKIKREILARSIDSLWKSRTEEQTIKMWVLFTDLSNDPNSIECAQSKSYHAHLIR